MLLSELIKKLVEEMALDGDRRLVDDFGYPIADVAFELSRDGLKIELKL